MVWFHHPEAMLPDHSTHDSYSHSIGHMVTRTHSAAGDAGNCSLCAEKEAIFRHPKHCPSPCPSLVVTYPFGSPSHIEEGAPGWGLVLSQEALSGLLTTQGPSALTSLPRTEVGAGGGSRDLCSFLPLSFCSFGGGLRVFRALHSTARWRSPHQPSTSTNQTPRAASGGQPHRRGFLRSQRQEKGP